MFGILGESKEEEVFSKIGAMSDTISEMVGNLQTLYSAVRKGDRDATIGISVKIKTLYERIGMQREEVMSLLFGEAFLPDFKESMVMLTQAVYNVAKAIKDTSRAYTTRKVSDKCIIGLGEQIEAYLSIVEEGANKLRYSIGLLKNNIKESIRIGREIQMLERSGDEVKESMLFKLYEMENQIDVVSLLQFKDIIIFTDDILDFMEEATMSIEILYSTLKS